MARKKHIRSNENQNIIQGALSRGRKAYNPAKDEFVEMIKTDERMHEFEIGEKDVQYKTRKSIIEQTPLYKRNPLNGKEREDAFAAIREKWCTMESMHDLSNLLNIAIRIIYGDNAKLYREADIRHQIIRNQKRNPYVSFRIPKRKKGEYRTIDAPRAGLRNMQKCLNLILQTIYSPHHAAKGFVPGRSVLDNATVHIGQAFLYNIDLKDFFPSISSGRIYKRLMAKPFSLKSDVASAICDLCCCKGANGKKVLPQGAPTSPVITNIICERLDIKLTSLSKAYGLKYTRYADDITASGMRNMFDGSGRFCTSLKNIVENEEHFIINTSKTRLAHRGMRQEVTGLVVNQRANVFRDYKKQVRTYLHNWEVMGYENAQLVFAQHYIKSHFAQQGDVQIPRMENVISGKLKYLKMVKGETDSTYKKLVSRFDKLENNLIPVAEASTKIEQNEGQILTELLHLADIIEINSINKHGQ